MTVNVIVTILWDEEWSEILSRLEKALDWKVRYICGYSDLKEKVRPDVLFEDVGLSIIGLEMPGDALRESPEIAALPEVPIGFDLLKKLSPYEFMIKYLINREYDKGNGRTDERYFDLIKYWLKIIDSTKPSLVIVPFLPYTAREYVLFALAKSLGITFLTFRSSTLSSYLYLPVSDLNSTFIDDVVTQYALIKNNSDSPLKIQDFAMKRIQIISDRKSTDILNDNELKLKSGAKLNFLTSVRDNTTIYLAAIRNEDLRSVRGYARIITNYFIKLYCKLSEFKKFISLKRTYDSYCISPDYTRPYIFFPLHYQPEWSTSPLGGYAVHQQLPIELIARSLPEGWVVYVKEHHSTFSPILWGWKKRSKEYYERISKLPNVFFIPIETESAVLIDRSRAVATVTGSIGIEGILRCKPVLTFGSAWYNGCEGVFPIHDFAGCKSVLEQIERGLVVDPIQMHKFVQASESVGAKVNFSLSMKNIGDREITREDTIINMVVCISKWWTDHVPHYPPV